LTIHWGKEGKREKKRTWPGREIKKGVSSEGGLIPGRPLRVGKKGNLWGRSGKGGGKGKQPPNDEQLLAFAGHLGSPKKWGGGGKQEEKKDCTRAKHRLFI